MWSFFVLYLADLVESPDEALTALRTISSDRTMSSFLNLVHLVTGSGESNPEATSPGQRFTKWVFMNDEEEKKGEGVLDKEGTQSVLRIPHEDTASTVSEPEGDVCEKLSEVSVTNNKVSNAGYIWVPFFDLTVYQSHRLTSLVKNLTILTNPKDQKTKRKKIERKIVIDPIPLCLLTQELGIKMMERVSRGAWWKKYCSRGTRGWGLYPAVVYSRLDLVRKKDELKFQLMSMNRLIKLG